MLLFFTGSDWCGWCIRLQSEVLKTTEFNKWAKDNVVLVELDFPRRTAQTPEVKAQNNELQQVFGIQGFPTVYFTNAESKDGKVNFHGRWMYSMTSRQCPMHSRPCPTPCSHPTWLANRQKPRATRWPWCCATCRRSLPVSQC